jgi:hypothetical protein
MKKIYLFSFFSLLFAIASCAQNETVDTVPMYKKQLTIPAFNIVTPDSAWYSKDSVPKNKPFVIIYFSPDCGHCQFEAKEIIKHSEDFKSVTFLWVSFHPLIAIKSFASQYGLDKLPNMIYGRDPKYFLPSFYRVEFTPYMAVYNAAGNFVKEFREGAKPEELAEAIK